MLLAAITISTFLDEYYYVCVKSRFLLALGWVLMAVAETYKGR